eukprot:10353962-Prorocentrum_lima.AAC.1
MMKHCAQNNRCLFVFPLRERVRDRVAVVTPQQFTHNAVRKHFTVGCECGLCVHIGVVACCEAAAVVSNQV